MLSHSLCLSFLIISLFSPSSLGWFHLAGHQANLGTPEVHQGSDEFPWSQSNVDNRESVDEVCEETLDAACSELAGIGVQNVPWIFVTSFLAILIGGFWKIFCPRRVYCCGRLGIPRGWGRVGPWRPRSVAEVTACCFHVTGECCWMEPGKKLPQGYKSDDICLSRMYRYIYIYMCVCVCMPNMYIFTCLHTYHTIPYLS